MSAHDPYSASQARLEWGQRLETCLVKFRRDLCQVLADNGVPSNPGWTEDDIVRAFRQLLIVKGENRL